ncbi:MAG: recombination regulator RecX [Lachnospiraceae bacterium]|nr:recombination regulator RecX [Lachnospiraceae bacterium]
MLLTEIKQEKTNKYVFKTDTGSSFFLTRKELSDLEALNNIQEVLGGEKEKTELEFDLSDSAYETISRELVIPRGKRYALSLLSDREYSSKMLMDKLSSTGYSSEHAEIIIDYVKSFHYLDDERYAENYIRSRMQSKSRRYLERKLYEKGISKELSEEIFSKLEEENCNESPSDIEKNIIRRELSKKLKSVDPNDHERITKVTAALVRKGFNYSDINESVSDYFKNLSS